MLSTAQRRELVPRELVVAHDDRLFAVDLAQQVEEVERERVVVVDQERAHRASTLCPTLARRRPHRADPRDGGDDDQPRRQRQLRRDGRRVGRAADRHQALPRDTDAAQPARDRGGGRQRDRRHPAVQPGGARRPAPADPSRRRASRERSWTTPARGASCASRRSTTASGAPASARWWSTAAPVASSSVSIARAMRCSRPRSSRRACAGSRPSDIRAELRRLQVLVDKTAGPREREAMEYVTRHVRAVIGDA